MAYSYPFKQFQKLTWYFVKQLIVNKGWLPVTRR